MSFSTACLLPSLSVLVFYLVCILLSGMFSVSSSATQTPVLKAPVNSGDLQLQLVQVLFRHGDRNPVNPYPNDPYKNESFWPEGFSQLTKRGKMQQYNLGVYMRERYDGFLSKYSPYEILVEASDVDRTLMSAEANLAGLYPPKESGTAWKNDLDWQPIPVHTKPTKYDNKLKMSAPCPYYEIINQKFLNSPLMAEVNAQNENIYKYLEENAGKSIKSPEDVDFLYDTLHIESMYNYTLPNWTHSMFPEPMHNITAFSFEMITYTMEMKRLKGGPLLKDIIQNMQGRVSKSMDERRKFFMYSAHDTTVSALLSTMQVFDRQTPPYACLVMVELSKNKSGDDYYVQVYFRNDTTKEPYLLIIPGCEEYCPFDQFVQLTKPVIPIDWNLECQRGNNFSAVSISALILGGVLAGMLLLSILSMAYLRHLRNNPNPPTYPYLHLQMEDEDA